VKRIRQYPAVGEVTCVRTPPPQAGRGWAAIGRRVVHVITEYAKWAEQAGDTSNSPFKGLSHPAVLRQSGLFAAWTPDQLLAKVPSMPDRSTFGFQPLVGGLSPEEGWKSLELLKQTMPKLTASRS
jgi:hypothetical protein